MELRGQQLLQNNEVAVQADMALRGPLGFRTGAYLQQEENGRNLGKLWKRLKQAEQGFL